MEAAGIEPAPDSPGTWIDGFRRRLLAAHLFYVVAATYVYAIQEGEDGPVKLGTALDPPDRLKSLQFGNPVRLRLLFFAPGTVRLEAFIHRELAAYQLVGEWFRLEGDVLDFLHELQSWSEVSADMGDDGLPEDIISIVRERVEARAA